MSSDDKYEEELAKTKAERLAADLLEADNPLYAIAHQSAETSERMDSICRRLDRVEARLKRHIDGLVREGAL